MKHLKFSTADAIKAHLKHVTVQVHCVIVRIVVGEANPHAFTQPHLQRVGIRMVLALGEDLVRDAIDGLEAIVA